MPDSGALASTREGLAAFLQRPNSTRKQVLARQRAVRKIIEQVHHFSPWPALEASLWEDIHRLEARLQEETK